MGLRITRKLIGLLAVVSTAYLPLSTAHAQNYVQGRDLISLHYDHAPDRDDGHAAAAAYSIVQTMGISPLVVGGAVGDGNQNRFVNASVGLMNTIWGGGSWLNAKNNFNGSVVAAGNRWRAVLANGGNIFVAEGGQSDFTAAVHRWVRARTNLPRNRVVVVQHSLWNEQQSNQGDLNYVRNNTVYRRIADGNGANSTADLNMRSSNFVNRARSSQFGRQWNAAFSYLNPNTKLDFSDTVELLHILRIPTSRIRNVNDFANVYFGNSANPTSTTAASGNTSGGVCTVAGSTLSQAVTNYNRQCSLPRRDCDRVGNQFLCSSANNPRSVTNTTAASTSAPTSNSNSGSCSATGSTLGVAKINYARQCSLPRRDCDPRNGQWICSSTGL